MGVALVRRLTGFVMKPPTQLCDRNAVSASSSRRYEHLTNLPIAPFSVTLRDEVTAMLVCNGVSRLAKVESKDPGQRRAVEKLHALARVVSF